MSAGARHFLRHSVEMAVAMLLGMAVAHPLVRPLTSEAPGLAVLVMALAMSTPMAAWMRHRRKSWARVAEMTAAMLVPGLLLAVLAAAGVIESGRAALDVQHALMFPAMLAAMLLRREAYTGEVSPRAPSRRGPVRPRRASP